MSGMPEVPLPLRQRKLLANTNDVHQKRPVSWSEAQINMLQGENRELRQYIIDQKRSEGEKDETLGLLRRQNAQFAQEIYQQSEMISKLVCTVAAAVQDFQEATSYRFKAGKRPENRVSSAGSEVVSEILHAYCGRSSWPLTL
jgi:hypothetical protein